MSQDALPVFFLGVTGYVGGPLLTRLVKLLPNAHVTALIRSEAVIPLYKAAGVHEVVHGTHKDLDKIRTASAAAEVVVNTADCTDVNLTRAILEGMKERYKQTGRRPVLIHTSGANVLGDKAAGVLDPDVAAAPYDDADEERIKTLPDDRLPRPVDKLIFEADAEGVIDGWIIAPPMIYGPSRGPVARETMMLPILLKFSLATKRVIRVGDGTSTWDNVHLEDLIDVYELIIKKALSAETRATRSSPYSKFILVSSGKHTHGEIMEIVAEALFKRGIIPAAEVQQVTLDEAAVVNPILPYVCNNSFAVPTKARKLGWTPKHLTWRKDVEQDAERILESLS
ncbi:NAD(P)-binding protein [Exidia glandulosa HHB12029]|uniref:NAD(P)-binding protein n=1 Tax=Exidia glandulosa HHB12029 TaxID=1314781 RepID=A0A166AT24_EXIGL|nr:NAD(P)-binding protein [Exidia glandulosa HHB12029]